MSYPIVYLRFSTFYSEITFKALSTQEPMSISEIKSASIGKLVSLRAIVLLCGKVEPLIEVATYTCDLCGAHVYQLVKEASYMPIFYCRSNECVSPEKVKGRLYLQTRGSKFVKHQVLLVQEHMDQIRIGHTPRTLAIICRGEVTRRAEAGDHVVITGIFLPKVAKGATTALQSFDTYIEAHVSNCLSAYVILLQLAFYYNMAFYYKLSHLLMIRTDLFFFKEHRNMCN